MGLITHCRQRLARFGSVVSAMGCAACFPGYRQLGGHRPWLSTGIRRLFISKLLPLFAVVGFAGECTGLAESSAMVPQPARDGRPSHRAGGHALVFGNGGRRTSSMSVWP